MNAEEKHNDRIAAGGWIFAALLAVFAGIMAGEASRWKRNAQEAWDSNRRVSKQLAEAQWALDSYAATEKEVARQAR